jgi:hypothetical protein
VTKFGRLHELILFEEKKAQMTRIPVNPELLTWASEHAGLDTLAWLVPYNSSIF